MQIPQVDTATWSARKKKMVRRPRPLRRKTTRSKKRPACVHSNESPVQKFIGVKIDNTRQQKTIPARCLDSSDATKRNWNGSTICSISLSTKSAYARGAWVKVTRQSRAGVDFAHACMQAITL